MATNQNNDLLPSISYNAKTTIYCYYIPYVTHDSKIQSIANNTYLMSQFLGLPVDRKHDSPSYTYSCSEIKHEIGFTGLNIETIYENIRNVQTTLKTNHCMVNDDLAKIEIK
jgi:hypothetical protein